MGIFKVFRISRSIGIFVFKGSQLKFMGTVIAFGLIAIKLVDKRPLAASVSALSLRGIFECALTFVKVIFSLRFDNYLNSIPNKIIIDF
jgi:hypothetical protein